MQKHLALSHFSIERIYAGPRKEVLGEFLEVHWYEPSKVNLSSITDNAIFKPFWMPLTIDPVFSENFFSNSYPRYKQVHNIFDFRIVAYLFSREHAGMKEFFESSINLIIALHIE